MFIRNVRKNAKLQTMKWVALLGRFGTPAVIVAVTLSSFAAGAPKQSADEHAGLSRIPGAAAVAALHRWIQTGQASWYGLRFQGHSTATGEKYDMNDLTCAHRSLPLGSWLRVTNLRNHKSVLVRVNDRGPMVDNRIVDLSYAAARAVGLNGIGRVRLEIASVPITAIASGDFLGKVQVQLRLPALPIQAS